MNYSKIHSNGSARDEALKRRGGAVCEVRGLDPVPKPDATKPAPQKKDNKVGE